MHAPTSVASPPRIGTATPGILPERNKESTCSSSNRVFSITEYNVRSTSGFDGEASVGREDFAETISITGSGARPAVLGRLVVVAAMQAGLRERSLYRKANATV